MSTLGKIVTVFIVLASIAIGAMVVTYARSSVDWRANALKAQGVINDADQAIASLKAALEARNTDLALQRQVYQTKIDNQSNLLSSLETARKDLEAKIREQETKLANLSSDISGLQKSFETVQTEKASLKETADKAVADAQKYLDANQDLAKKRHDLQRMVDDLTVKVKEYAEQIAELDKQVAWFKQNWPGGEVPGEVKPLPSVDLTGVVKAADNSRKVAEISLGSRDQVVEGMTFMISRGSEFLADLEITKVDENSSVGKLKTVQGDVQEGDHVTFDVRR